MAATVLIVEDELRLRELLRAYLERSGHVVLSTGSGVEALQIARRARPALMVLDLRLPDIPGEEVTREVREFSDLAVVMLTAKAAAEDRIRGFETGADDYITKPFSPKELVLRVDAILRRGRKIETTGAISEFGLGELVIDEDRRDVAVRGNGVELTPTEWGILQSLAQMPGRVYSRAELVNRVRGYEFEGYERIVDSHVKNLRQKIEADPHQPRIILTVLGGGYRLGLWPDG